MLVRKFHKKYYVCDNKMWKLRLNSIISTPFIVLFRENIMTKQLSIITIHGMGDTDRDYNQSLVQWLKQEIGTQRWDNDIHVESVFYQDLLQGNQEDYWHRINQKYHLRWDFLRRFMLYKFSDGASIEHSLHADMSLYLGVHRTISTAFDNSLNALGDADKPVIIIGHSLGCEQISNYIWDAERDLRFFSNDDWETPAQRDFRRLKSCKLFVSTGCNIPIFRVGMSQPRRFSAPNDAFKWHNYFDVHDILGYPLKDMYRHDDTRWIEDRSIRVSGWFKRWTPLSHGQYWESRNVIKPIAQEIKRLLNN